MKLEFADGKKGIVDLSHLVGKGVFALWDDYNKFKMVKIGSSGELMWDDQIDIQFGGEEGIETIKNYIPDSTVTMLDFYANWTGDRDELIFNMGFNIDMAVDVLGNPYIIGMISLANEDGNWYPKLGTEWAVY